MRCSACGHENRPDRRFCVDCGQPLAAACPECGAPTEPGERFCGECGTRLDGDAPAAAVPAVERRLVSVLFADLVGFTPRSEGRDAEEVRELLTRYFETARQVIGRYGGTVEKFIGDAVMAVWGAPSAQEDDAERAVRAALELVDAVGALDDGLAARAGILTGEAAVTVGAEGQGMVAGDLVNTAARIQSAAEAGTVLAGESTRRASEAAIDYAEAGAFELKGKAEPQQLWRALRVAATRGGQLRAQALEPPFVGRERELRLVKDLFHASAEQGKAHLISVVGIAGIGKSRLAWELQKYLDGLTQLVRWHRGRCLAYGDGVAYWALAEMVRTRVGVADGDPPALVRERVRAALAEIVAEPDERDWIEPALAVLLGLDEDAPEKERLFGAWRLFFERLAERDPVVLVFEDLQWADAALLEFVGYLLEWARNRAILVVALTRPELADRHPQWAGSTRNATTLALEPLAEEAMGELLDGLVPGLPATVRDQILARAEGVPLYAVETVRMLLDRGIVAREGDAYRLTSPVDELDVPETLHALIAARLDGLTPDERHLLQDAAVVGKTFTIAALAAVSGRDEAGVSAVLGALVRKEILAVQADPLSPERGQYGFLQDLLRQVAYETLAKPERRARHLAAAAHLEELGDESELAEVVAAHYLAAHEAEPDAADAPEIRTRARATLVRAADRAASLAATGEAQRYFERALELADDPLEEAELRERAGRMGRLAGRLGEAQAHLERAITLLESAGRTHAAARVTAALGRTIAYGGEIEEGIAVMERAFSVLADEEPDPDTVALASELTRMLMLNGRPGEALDRLEPTLRAAEAMRLPEVIAQGLITKGSILVGNGRNEEGGALLRRSLELALEHDLAEAATRAYNNLGWALDLDDRLREALALQDSQLELARRVGDRVLEVRTRLTIADLSREIGHWDAAGAEARSLLEDEPLVASLLLATMHAHRAEPAEARQLADGSMSARDPGDVQWTSYCHATDALLLLAEGRPAEALAEAEAALALRTADRHSARKAALAVALEAAAVLNDEAKTDELLGWIAGLPPSERSPRLHALGDRYGARRAARRGDHETARVGFEAAARIYRELELPLELAQTLLDHGEWLAAEGRADEAEPLLAEAEGIFGRLGAALWLERVERCRAATGAAAAAG